MRARTVGAAGVVVGLLAGWLWDRAPDRGDVPAPADVGACAEPVRAAVDAIAAEHARLFGTPEPFPDDLPPEYLPDAFRANLDRALAECDTRLALIDVDCSEYPCLAAFEGEPLSRGLFRCPAWTGAYTPVPVHWGTIATADGERSWLLYTGARHDEPRLHNLLLRLELRRDEIRDQLFARWDGSSTASDHRATQSARLRESVDALDGARPQGLAELLIVDLEHQIEEIERVDALEAARGAQ